MDAAAAKKKAEGSFFGDLVASAFNVVLTVSTVGLLGFAAVFFSSAKSDADKAAAIKFTKDPAGRDGDYTSVVKDD